MTKLADGKASVEAIVPETSALPLALTAPGFDGGRIKVTALRAPLSTPLTARVIAHASNGRPLGEASLNFAANSGKAEATIELPIELRNEIGRIAIDGERNAGAVFLMDDRWRRKTVALQSGVSSENAQPLLSPLYYVSRALEPFAELSEPADAATLKAQLDQGLSMLVLADIGVLPEDQQRLIGEWVNRGGVLLRFAGPRLAGAQDSLIPCACAKAAAASAARSPGKRRRAFRLRDASPFAGLANDPAVKVTRQVLAEPDSDLPDRVWAALDDGTRSSPPGARARA